jgi:hypothetical protein
MIRAFRPAKYFALVCALQLLSATPATASGLTLLMNSQLVAAIQAVSVPNTCIRYTYDLNGNRKTQTSSAFGAPGVTWGSAVYGCFGWTS